MRRSAAGGSLVLGAGHGGFSLSRRELAVLGLAVLVLVPAVAIGRHTFALPSLVERGLAWLVPGSEPGRPVPISPATPGPGAQVRARVAPTRAAQQHLAGIAGARQSSPQRRATDAVTKPALAGGRIDVAAGGPSATASAA